MEELDIITLDFEDGESLNCGIVDFCEVEGQSYVAVLEVNDEGEAEDDSEMYIFRYTDSEDGKDFSVEDLEDEAEFKKALDCFEAMWDTEDAE